MENDINTPIETTCCFTGHRPEKIKGTEKEIRLKLREEINRAISSGYDTFITGLAPGVDTWAALEVLKIKESNKNIKHFCAVPFKGVEKNRTKEQIIDFNYIISNSNDMIYISEKYARWCFLARDKWMVNRSKRVIAVFNGTKGGTEFTISYAKKKGREIVLIDDACV